MIMSDNKPSLQPERIKSFVISMILDAFDRPKQDNVDLRIKLEEAITEILNTISEIDPHSDRYIKIGVDSIIEGVFSRKAGLIDRLQKQVDFAQVRLNYEKNKLQEEIQLVVELIENMSETQSEQIQQVIKSTIEDI